MQHISMTPFGRQPVTAGLLASQALADTAGALPAVDKWQLLRDLTTGRKSYGISDRDLSVLSALLSFHPQRALQDDALLVVYPSNASLCDRAHGMAESTLRRHLAALVRAGLILRRDSPNGKRFARRGLSGAPQAFGFDLRPLLAQAADIAETAQRGRDAELRLRLMREEAVLLLRDAAKLIAWGQEHHADGWDRLTDALALAQRGLRRKPEADFLQRLIAVARNLLDDIRDRLPRETVQTSGNDSQNERHLQNSTPERFESESCEEQQIETAATELPLELVLKATPEIQAYAQQRLESWQDLTRLCDFLHPMLGVPERVWATACAAMGREGASVTLACMMQRLSKIAHPAGYLRHLAQKAGEGGFSPAPMVRALLRADTPQPG